MMRRALTLIVALVMAVPSFAGGILRQPILNGAGFESMAMYSTPFWFVSIRSSVEQAAIGMEPGDVIVETEDANAPYLLLRFDQVMSCGGPWVPMGDPWIAEPHDSKESAEARAQWFQWPSRIVKAPSGTWILVYRNPDVP